MIIDQIKEEIRFEEKLLSRYKSILKSNRGGHLIAVHNHGTLQFYRGSRSSKKRQYIRRGDPKLDEIYIKRFARKAAENLEENIKLLERFMKSFRRYDIESVNEMLPKSYQDAYNFLSMRVTEPGQTVMTSEGEVIQSENPFFRENLVHKVTNGLYVRSKNEMLIAEMLLQFNIPFRYEKRLELECVEINQYGQANYYIKTVYPDFTIFLPNDEALYWEHEGGMDDPNYRRPNIEKLNCYFMNGILIPDKLILTMDGDGSPFDNSIILKVIEDFILPRMGGTIL